MPSIQDILAIAMAAGALWYLVRSVRHTLSAKGGCHCSAANAGSCGATKSSRRIRKIPLVSITSADKQSLSNGRDESPKCT